jgi:hypothetical protein
MRKIHLDPIVLVVKKLVGKFIWVSIVLVGNFILASLFIGTQWVGSWTLGILPIVDESKLYIYIYIGLVVPLSFQHLLDDFYFYFFIFCNNNVKQISRTFGIAST